MKHVTKTRSIQLLMVVVVALLAVPIAQAKQDANFSPQGPTALGLKADGLRLQAQADLYAVDPAIARAMRQNAAVQAMQNLPEDRTVAVQLRREAKAINAANSSAPISENSPIELRVQPGTQPVTSVHSTSFNWGDAGIGAGIAALLTSLAALGAGGVVSRKRTIAHA